jgi:Predicted membrane protein
MKKSTLLIAVGSVLGAVGAYFAYKRKDEILAKLSEIQENLKEAELTEKAKTAVNDLIERLTSLIKKEETLTKEEKEKTLAEIEEKVKKLEEDVYKQKVNNKVGVVKTPFKILYLSLKDYMANNYAYHSSALTFYFLMTIFPLLFFIISVISLLAIINISEIYFILYKIFPNSAESFLNTVLKLSQSQVAQKSIVITILLSIFFSKDLFVAISQAFSYIYEAKVAEGRVILIISMLALPFLATLILIFYVFYLS